jgi:hypothetical protein
MRRDEKDMVPSSVINALSTSLTRLSFSGVLAMESLQPFSRLVKLQHLYMNLQLGVQVHDTDLLEVPEDTAQSAQQPFAHLQALTFLSLCMEEEPKLDRASSAPPLAGCSGLQELHLYSPSLDGSTFQELTGLRRLHVTVPAVGRGGAAATAGSVAAANSVAAVLSDIGHMQHLEHLVMSVGFLGGTVTLGGGDAELCGALTASNGLMHLDLSGLKLPNSAWQHMFPAGRHLAQLPVVRLCFDQTAGATLDQTQLEHMVACCPAVTRLRFEHLSPFKPSVSLAPLLLLRQLADFECPCVMDGASSVGVLACMSVLTRLHVCASSGLTDDGLMQLTALTGLQELGMRRTNNTWQSLTILGSMDWTLKVSCNDGDVLLGNAHGGTCVHGIRHCLIYSISASSKSHMRLAQCAVPFGPRIICPWLKLRKSRHLECMVHAVQGHKPSQ